MTQKTLLTLGALAVLTSTATAQQVCSDNLYKLWLTDASGQPVPTYFDPMTGETVSRYDSEAVYLAFDPTLPTGTYYVHVTDRLDGIADMVLSTNDPMDRFVRVENQNGAITLSLPFSTNTPVTGLGLNGVGESLLLQPFAANPSEPCRFKAWFGDAWDLTNGPANPYLLAGGIHPTTGVCAIRSYETFQIGDGSGTDVAGVVFEDTDRDGVRDPGEGGAAGWEVRLVTATSSVSTTTNSSGEYLFADVAADSYTVELVSRPGYITTTAGSFAIEVCGCANIAGGDFGVAAEMARCEARTIGYWRNRHGLCKVHQYGILAHYPALGLVNMCGRRVSLDNLCEYKFWLRCANSWNMAYMLSAQLVAMRNNVVVGFVDPNCVVDDPCLGRMTIGDLMQEAVLSLWAHPFTPWCSPHRARQAKLKDALDRANNNQIWL